MFLPWRRLRAVTSAVYLVIWSHPRLTIILPSPWLSWRPGSHSLLHALLSIPSWAKLCHYSSILDCILPPPLTRPIPPMSNAHDVIVTTSSVPLQEVLPDKKMWADWIEREAGRRMERGWLVSW